jgi:hypothetical protein
MISAYHPCENYVETPHNHHLLSFPHLELAADLHNVGVAPAEPGKERGHPHVGLTSATDFLVTSLQTVVPSFPMATKAARSVTKDDSGSQVVLATSWDPDHPPEHAFDG